MARRSAFLHIGPTPSEGDFLDHALADHAAGLAEQGVLRPTKSGEEMFRAVVEIRRVHKAWGYRRREVEGAWSGICRRAHKGVGTVVLSAPHLALATSDEIALLLDGLAGFDVHVVVTVPTPGSPTPGRWSDQDLSLMIDRWTGPLRGLDRLHVITPPPGDPVSYVWAEFARIVGFDATRMPVADWVEDWTSTAESTEERLALALEELERQRVRNDVLQGRNDELARKRKTLKRRLAEAVAG